MKDQPRGLLASVRRTVLLGFFAVWAGQGISLHLAGTIVLLPWLVLIQITALVCACLLVATSPGVHRVVFQADVPPGYFSDRLSLWAGAYALLGVFVWTVSLHDADAFWTDPVMLLLVLGGLGAAAVLAILLGFLPPPHASTLIRIRNGSVRVQRGLVSAQAREHIADILRDAGVARGYIAILPGDGMMFSSRIPSSIRQRLRNVLRNQWA